ncbi:MAG: heavy metal-binding domain-containing protein [Planctomycetota bacterium]
MDLIFQIIMLPVGLLFGGMAERKHFRQLDQREAQNRVRVDTRKLVGDPGRVQHAQLVFGQVVVATDYWKSFLMKLRNLVGGEAKSANSLMHRGRREALMRLCDAADALGADEVWNVRLEFSNISMMRGNQAASGHMQVEIFAYGTAVKRPQ